MPNNVKGKPNQPALIRNFVIELVVYGVFVVAYFFIVLRLLGSFLTNLFHSDLVMYAFLALTLIVIQGVLLDAITSFLLNLFKLELFD